ncbi:ABC transporter permease [Actinosynnema sp. NPDC091369]
MTGTTTTAAPVTERARVGWGDLAWLTWRQHRWAIVVTALAVGAVAALAVGMASHADATGEAQELFGEWGYLGVSQALASATTVLGAVIAVFWAAPLLSREYEQRTHLVVWSQDVGPLRWLAAKVVLLGVTATALAAVLGVALIKLMNSMNAVVTGFAPFMPFYSDAFEAAPQVQVGYAAFGFALGLAFSAITRRTVLSMGLTLGVYLAVRAAVAGFWRPFYQEPLRKVETYGQHTGWNPDNVTWTVRSSYSDAAGNEITFPQGCSDTRSYVDFTECMDDRGVHFVSEYHPIDRLVPFQLIEAGIFLAFAAGLLVLAFTWVRRARRA